jgi:hypothetical protein
VEVPIEGIFKLEPDHPIHQVFGPMDNVDGAVPRWQSDEAFLATVSAMCTLKGGQRELQVIERERRALQVWAHDENLALTYALRDAGTNLLILYLLL